MRPTTTLVPRIGARLCACFALVFLVACGGPDPMGDDAGAMDAAMSADGGGLDAGPSPDGGPTPDAASGPDAATGCDPTCPPEFCMDGTCIVPGDCCYTGFCPGSLRCDWRSCGCVAPTGCCAGEPCEGTEICDFESCTCARPDDCCHFGFCDFPRTCSRDSCGCEMDTSCGPSCVGPDRVCYEGFCYASCTFEGCPDGLYCDEEAGCVTPRCTEDECAAGALRCDPSRGCFDPCTERDYSWCTSMGGRCFMGECVDDSCGGGAMDCRYVDDCCGNTVCWDVASGETPFCDPTSCGPEPRRSPRDDLCRCGMFGDIFLPDGGDGRGGGGPPPPPGGRYCVDLYYGGFIGRPVPFGPEGEDTPSPAPPPR